MEPTVGVGHRKVGRETGDAVEPLARAVGRVWAPRRNKASGVGVTHVGEQLGGLGLFGDFACEHDDDPIGWGW